MLRSKLGLLGLCTMVLGIMAMSASAAHAVPLYTWLVLHTPGGVVLEVTEPLPVVSEPDTKELTLLTHLVGLSVSVSCTNSELSGISLEKEGTLTKGGKVVFTGCKVSTAGCKVKSPGAAEGTVVAQGKGHLLLHEPSPGKTELLTQLEPEEAGGTFATLRFEGECALPESNKVTGSLWVKDCEGKGEVHAVKHLIIQGPLTSLSVGADTKEHLETSIDGSLWIRLLSSKEWGGMHNKP